jgi:hypothetical protein
LPASAESRSDNSIAASGAFFVGASLWSPGDRFRSSGSTDAGRDPILSSSVNSSAWYTAAQGQPPTSRGRGRSLRLALSCVLARQGQGPSWSVKGILKGWSPGQAQECHLRYPLPIVPACVPPAPCVNHRSAWSLLSAPGAHRAYPRRRQLGECPAAFQRVSQEGARARRRQLGRVRMPVAPSKTPRSHLRGEARPRAACGRDHLPHRRPPWPLETAGCSWTHTTTVWPLGRRTRSARRSGPRSAS